jgi:hypothetical protein
MTRHSAFAVIALALCASCREARGPERTTTPPPLGEWRSTVQVGDRPEVTLRLASAADSGLMSLRGERRGVQEWTTMTVQRAAWNGSQMTFETVLPDDEGKVYWALYPIGDRRARLIAIPDDADPGDPPAQWSLEAP